MRIALVALVSLALAACGSAGKPASTKLDGVVLKRGVVDTTLAAGVVTDPYLPDGSRPAAGHHFVGIQLTWLDRDAPFPAAGRASRSPTIGARTTTAILSPLKKTFPGRPQKGQPQTQIVALEIADDHRPARLELSSIVARWRFSANFDLR